MFAGECLPITGVCEQQCEEHSRPQGGAGTLHSWRPPTLAAVKKVNRPYDRPHRKKMILTWLSADSAEVVPNTMVPISDTSSPMVRLL